MHGHALVRRRPATDTITDGTCPPPVTDQRSVKRPQDGNTARLSVSYYTEDLDPYLYEPARK